MLQVTRERYGSPDVLSIVESPAPSIGEDGVLVRVRATSVNAADWHLMRGRPIVSRLGLGLRRPKDTGLGIDLAGVVEAVGPAVTELRPGDEVFGARDGAFAELVAARVRNLVPKPSAISFEQAAAIPVAATTALQAVRDIGGVKPGQRVLVIGAGGGVGSFVVQIAVSRGAAVTAVTRASHIEAVRRLGAGEVVDYERTDVTRAGRWFDVILDVGGYRSLRDLARILEPDGCAVLVGAGKGTTYGLAARLLAAALRRRLRGQRMRFFLARTNRDDLLVLADLAARGSIVPLIDRTYPLREVADAVRYAETGRVLGKVVVTV
jgi:NADPH:quinone reductase-like Zn-dependent oxidoreductase